MGQPFPIGCTFDQRTLVLVKKQILKEAIEDYNSVKDIDEVLRVEHYANFRRLKETLDLLIPPEMEELVLPRSGDGDSSEGEG
jgi:hypothetical protein